jgi:CRP-like cAMP-binding protein
MDEIIQILRSTNPFHVLSHSRLPQLASECALEEAAAGQWLFRAGDFQPGRPADAFVLLTGEIEFQGGKDTSVRVVGTPNFFFGENSAIFDEPRSSGARVWKDARLLRVRGRSIISLLLEGGELRTAQILSGRVRRSEVTFIAISDFEFKLEAALDRGLLNVQEMIPAYLKLEPAIHAGARDLSILDIESWSYAVNRLPAHINEIFAFLVSTRMHDVERYGLALPTAMRRRTSRLLMPGKAFVLLRPGQSDLIDFVSCMCLHVVECKKLREAMKPLSRSLQVIDSGLRSLSDVGSDRNEITCKVLEVVCSALSAHDVKSLMHMWPSNLLEQLRYLCLHHGDYVIYADTKTVESSSENPSELWERRLVSAAQSICGCALDAASIVVDILSSNVKSAWNCLSPYLRENRDLIEAWANTSCVLIDDNLSPEDRFYAISERYFAAFPGKLEERRERDERSGIVELEEKEFTGITVQLFNITKLIENDSNIALVDSSLHHVLRHRLHGRVHLLVNVDFAFGEQAQHVLRSMLISFGKAIRSVNVMGKAGGLVGARGDILFPTHFVREKSELPDYRYLDNGDVDLVKLHHLSLRPIHVGPMVTIPGTLMQNRRLLRFYSTIWSAIGIEMEGTYFEDALTQARLMGIIDSDSRSRYVYYVSDTPLKGSSSSLSLNMTLGEEVTPQYAVTRLLLELMLLVPPAPSPSALSLSPSSSAAAAAPPPLLQQPAGPSEDSASLDDIKHHKLITLKSLANTVQSIKRFKIHSSKQGELSTAMTEDDLK